MASAQIQAGQEEKRKLCLDCDHRRARSKTRAVCSRFGFQLGIDAIACDRWTGNRSGVDQRQGGKP